MQQLPVSPTDGKSFRILVVEDDPIVARMIMVNLEKAKLLAFHAQDGRHGWQAFCELNPHLVLSDISMPGMTGHELLCKIREHSYVPVILMTAMDSDTHEMQGFKKGADDYVPKPFNPQLMLARIIANLRRVYKYQLDTGEEPETSRYTAWPTCNGCGYMAPSEKFEMPGTSVDKIFACPVCKGRSLVFPLAG